MRRLLSFGHWLPLIRRLPTPGSAALTFDDGPTPETTPKLLDMLARAKARATFFVNGARVAGHPELVAAIVEGGHGVYGHGWDHVNLERMPERALADMRRVEAELSRFRPTPPIYLLRLPYNAGQDNVRIHQAMTRFHPNVQFAWWTHDTFDYEIANRCGTIAEVTAECRHAADVLGRSPGLDRGVVVIHEKPFDVDSPFNAETAILLTPMVLDKLAARGLNSVPLQGAANGHSLLRRWILAPTTPSADPRRGNQETAAVPSDLLHPIP